MDQSKHHLDEFESDFLEPGYIAVCSCGWRSPNLDSMEMAEFAHKLHTVDVEKTAQQERKS